MKQLISLTLVFSLFSCAVQAQLLFSQGGIGKVMVKQQTVTVVRDGKETTVGSLGFLLEKGDVIQTGDEGKAQIVLTSGDAVFMGPSTKLIVTETFLNPDSSKKMKRYVLSVWGKILAKVQQTAGKDLRVQTPTAVIGVKGTEFVVEYVAEQTTVGTLNGLVHMQSATNQNAVDIPPGKMASVSPAGDVLPLTAFAGRLMKDMEFAGAQMKEEDAAGEKLKMK
ncbi:FecR family protein [Deltaproteobacteria bacterium TL4]